MDEAYFAASPTAAYTANGLGRQNRDFTLQGIAPVPEASHVLLAAVAALPSPASPAVGSSLRRDGQ